MKARILIMLSILLCCSTAVMAAAEEQPDKPFLTKPFTKFGRGVVNVISAPLEIPNQIYLLADHADENSRYGVETAAGAIEGLFNGTGIGIWRLVVGVYEVITFPIPAYESGLIDPPYITSSYEAYYERPDAVVSAGNDNRSPELNGEEVDTPPATGGTGNDAPPSAGEEGDDTASPAEVQ